MTTNTLVYGVFNDVDIRSEARFDELETDFTHLTLDAEPQLLRHAGSCMDWSGIPKPSTTIPCRRRCCSTPTTSTATATTSAATDRLPVITYGNVDVTNPATWTLSQIRLRPQSSENTFKTGIVRGRMGC